MGLAGFRSSSNGFSIVEVLFAMGILTVVSLGVAQLFAIAASATIDGRGRTSTTVLAEQKMEQLRSLTWGFDAEGLGLPVSDTTTNLAVYPHTQNGTGLNPSPAGTLAENVAGFVDYLDARGEWIGTGVTPPTGTIFVRRWSIQPLPTNPNNTIVLQVLVTSRQEESARGAGAQGRTGLRGHSSLVTVRTRKSQ